MPQPLLYFAIYRGALAGDKARDLEAELRGLIPDPRLGELVVAGVLAKLWERAAAQGEDDGALGVGLDAKRLARALRWPYDPEALVEALVSVGWVEQHDEDLAAHEWVEHQPAVKRRVTRRTDPPAGDQRPPPDDGGDQRPPMDATGNQRPPLASDPDKEGRREGRKDPDPPLTPPPGGSASGGDPPELIERPPLSAYVEAWNVGLDEAHADLGHRSRVSAGVVGNPPKALSKAVRDHPDPEAWRWAAYALAVSWKANKPGADTFDGYGLGWLTGKPKARITEHIESGDAERAIGRRKHEREDPYASTTRSDEPSPWARVVATVKSQASAVRDGQSVKIDEPRLKDALRAIGGSKAILSATPQRMRELEASFREALAKPQGAGRPRGERTGGVAGALGRGMRA